MPTYVVHFLGQSEGVLQPVYDTILAAQTVAEGHGAAIKLLPFVNAAVGFRLVDQQSRRQVDAFIRDYAVVSDA